MRWGEWWGAGCGFEGGGAFGCLTFEIPLSFRVTSRVCILLYVVVIMSREISLHPRAVCVRVSTAEIVPMPRP
jgi:hypothetical protein